MRRTHLAAATLVLVGGLTLSACGSNGASSGSSGSTSSDSASASTAASSFNDADVTFATDMIPHHRQAMAMAKLAATRSRSPQVKALAQKIVAAQGPEITTMSGWLKSWGKPVPQEMKGMNMSSSMPGMMSTKGMDQLSKASGATFDRMFLTSMIEHHKGAITMAKKEQSGGKYADAVQLAKKVETDQAKEIATMQGLLG